MTLSRSIAVIFAVSITAVASGCEKNARDLELRAWLSNELEPSLLKVDAAVCNIEQSLGVPNPAKRLCPSGGDVYQKPPPPPP